VRKNIAVATVLFFGLLCAASAHATTFNVSLDGYCNTFALTISSWEIYGTRSGCGYTVIDGGAVANVAGKAYYLTNDSNDLAEQFSWYFTKPKKKAGKWYLYESTGSGFSLINSGTYTQTSPDMEPNTTSDKDVTASRN